MTAATTKMTAPLPAVLAVLPGADVYAELDGLRASIRKTLTAEISDCVGALALVAGVLDAICEAAPAWCPGCPDRGDGLQCAVCGAPVPAALRREGGRS
jgi:hypothetical protein